MRLFGPDDGRFVDLAIYLFGQWFDTEAHLRQVVCSTRLHLLMTFFE
jgi:hypothetical protein